MSLPPERADEDSAGPDQREIGTGTVLRQRYLIGHPIGSGGTSTVFTALDRHRLQGAPDDRMVAVKVLHPKFRNDRLRVRRLIREFRYMQKLTHPGIARVFDLDCDDGVWFITMELFHGETLNRYLHRRAPQGLATDEAMHILTQCAQALACAHEHAVVHGDLKPANIFIDSKGAAHLLDFGSVPDQVGIAASEQHQFATPAYASPQVLEEEPAQIRDDLFSLGCIAYELFSGQHPFARKSSVQARNQGLKLTWLSSIPARHFGDIARMLSWDREGRPASALAFLDSLVAAQERAKAAYARESPPVVPPAASDDGLTEPLSAAPPAAVISTPRPEPKTSVGNDRESRRSQPSEETLRAFSQFAGKVPDDWVEAHERSGTPDEDPDASDEPAAKMEPAQVRWSRPIPHEWLEPAIQLHDVPPVSVSTAEDLTEDLPLEDFEASEEIHADKRPWAKPRWHALSWVQRRTHRTQPEPQVLEHEVTQDLAPHPPEPQREPPSIDAADETPPREAVEQVPPTPPSRFRIGLHWSALAHRLRDLRTAASLRTRDVVVDTAAAQTQRNSEPAPAPASWIPQLELGRRMELDATDLQPMVSRYRIACIQADPPFESVAAEPTLEHSQQPSTAQSVAPIAVPPPPRPALFSVFLDGARDRTQQAAAKLSGACSATVQAVRGWSWPRAQLVRAAARLAQGWQALRTIRPAPQHRTRRPVLHAPRIDWLRWREAIPLAAISSVALVTLVLLQFSNTVSSASRVNAERGRLADLRLSRLAEMTIALHEPQITVAAPTAPAIERSQPIVNPALGLISFQSARIHVGSQQRMAVINLRRDKSTAGAVPVSWRIKPGTARPGVDFESPATQVVRFNDGQDVRSLFIPINQTDAPRPERRFIIQLRKTPGGPAFGHTTETEVVLAGTG